MDPLQQNLKFAFRQLWRDSGFTATVVVTLAFSIGANPAIFSLVNALLLKTLFAPRASRHDLHPSHRAASLGRATSPERRTVGASAR
jgi:hypothetical protein